jgi:hypothetical protein
VARHPSTTTAAIGPVSRVDFPRLQHAELVALRVGEDRPRYFALAHVGGRRAKSPEARDQLRLMGRRGGGEIEVHTVLCCCLGFRDGNDVDADADRVRPNEAADGSNVGQAGSLVNTPAERLRPEQADRRVIKSLIL